jgi:hypothetical protein
VASASRAARTGPKAALPDDVDRKARGGADPGQDRAAVALVGARRRGIRRDVGPQAGEDVRVAGPGRGEADDLLGQLADLGRHGRPIGGREGAVGAGDGELPGPADDLARSTEGGVGETEEAVAGIDVPEVLRDLGLGVGELDRPADVGRVIRRSVEPSGGGDTLGGSIEAPEVGGQGPEGVGVEHLVGDAHQSLPDGRSTVRWPGPADERLIARRAPFAR